MCSSKKQNYLEYYQQELSRIVESVKYLRSRKPGKETSWKQAAEWHLKYSNYNGESALALTITLSPTGCEWARQGGCTMCGEFEGAYKRETLITNPQFHIAQFAAAIGSQDVWEAAYKEGKNISWLRIIQEGNYTNPQETNIISQGIILQLATHIKGTRRVTIESRPQYLNEENVSFLAKIFANTGVELEIGMGLEAEDHVIRNVCINKRGSNVQFINAVSLLKKHGIFPLAYILLKPPFLTEKEAIDEAVSTAHFAAKIGFLRISFEPMSIHSYTLVDALRQVGDYKVPWLWSVVEVAKKCSDISKIFGIGGVGYYPIPIQYAHNYCDNEKDCNEEFLAAILNYNATRDVNMFNDLSCSCRDIWESDCRISYVPLKSRIQKQLTHVESMLPTYSASETSTNDIVRSSRIIAGNSQAL
jgi:hypothetical protein